LLRELGVAGDCAERARFGRLCKTYLKPDDGVLREEKRADIGALLD
jgi:hypothetical protein